MTFKNSASLGAIFICGRKCGCNGAYDTAQNTRTLGEIAIMVVRWCMAHL